MTPAEHDRLPPPGWVEMLHVLTEGRAPAMRFGPGVPVVVCRVPDVMDTLRAVCVPPRWAAVVRRLRVGGRTSTIVLSVLAASGLSLDAWELLTEGGQIDNAPLHPANIAYTAAMDAVRGRHP